MFIFFHQWFNCLHTQWQYSYVWNKCFCFMKENADVPTLTIDVYSVRTVILCLDVTTINIVWIAIGVHCGVMVHWWMTGNEIHITVHYISIRQYLIGFKYPMITYNIRWIWTIWQSPWLTYCHSVSTREPIWAYFVIFVAILIVSNVNTPVSPVLYGYIRVSCK